MKKIFYSIAILSGTIIGVGLFALPNVTMRAGIWPVMGFFLLLGVIAYYVHYLFAEVALHTPDYKRMPGFAHIYLGNIGRKVALTSAILGLTGALLSYVILGGQFLYELASPYFSGNIHFYSLLYFAIGALVIYLGIKTTSSVSFWGLILFFLILILVFFKGFPYLETTNLLANKIDFSNIFLPYGVILFSLWGAALIPEIEEFLGKDKQLIKKIILPAILIPIVVYLVFIVLILGITGSYTTEFAIDGLRGFFGNGIVSLMLFFGLLTTFTSFVVLGLTLKKVFWFDFKINKELSWFLACFPAIFLYFLGFQDFIWVVGFVGAVMLATDGILVSLMYRKLGILKPEAVTSLKKFIVYPIVIIFTLGIFYEIYYFITKL